MGNRPPSLSPTQSRVIDCALRILEHSWGQEDAPAFNSNTAASLYFKCRLAGLEREEFHACWLNTQNRLIATEAIFLGTIHETSVYPREVVKSALRHNASAVIIAHNHPSGAADPSEADIALTARLKEALALVDVRLLDHIIVAGATTVSLAERGLLRAASI